MNIENVGGGLSEFPEESIRGREFFKKKLYENDAKNFQILELNICNKLKEAICKKFLIYTSAKVKRQGSLRPFIQAERPTTQRQRALLRFYCVSDDNVPKLYAAASVAIDNAKLKKAQNAPMLA